jgi:hypothetical protein
MDKLEDPVVMKFQKVTIDKDTKIRSAKYVKVGEYDARVEKWFWEGIDASSIIFLKAEVEHLTNKELIDLIRQETAIHDNFTFKDTGEYLFFNYGFIY